MSFYNRLVRDGTISDEEKPNPAFALPATVNWMRSLALIIENERVNFTEALQHYGKVSRKTFSIREENTILEQLFLAYHHLSALEQMKQAKVPSDFSRIAIIAWYYGIYHASAAMVTAKSGSFKDDHSGTARLWDNQIAANGLSIAPFNLRLSSLEPSVVSSEIARYRIGSAGDLQRKPNTPSEAMGALVQYLSGSADWYSWREIEHLKASKEFKVMNVTNFRTKAAITLRNDFLRKKSISFVHQAFRYRGKANYREALFLAYGKKTNILLEGFVYDLSKVLEAFVVMAGAFTSKRISPGLWKLYTQEIEANRSFSLSTDSIWKII